jgi:hypothetical protein
MLAGQKLGRTHLPVTIDGEVIQLAPPLYCRVRNGAWKLVWRPNYLSVVGGELPGELGLTLPSLSTLRAFVSIARCSASDLQIVLYRWLPISRVLRHF